jgi:hypothetical protein
MESLNTSRASDKENYTEGTVDNLLQPFQQPDGEVIALGSLQYRYFPYSIPLPSLSHLFVFKGLSQGKQQFILKVVLIMFLDSNETAHWS